MRFTAMSNPSAARLIGEDTDELDAFSVKTVPVLIVGGGPVGLTLAITLAHFGVRTMLVERNPTTTQHPKMDITNGRSMELFARVGVAAALRAVGTTASAPFDVSWITTLSGRELHRFRYGGAEAFAARIAEASDGSQPSQAPMRASQIMVEPALRAVAEARQPGGIRFAVALERFVDHGDHVEAVLRRAHDGLEERVRCAWLIGCDGGGSAVRQQLDIGTAGEGVLGERFVTHFRSDARDLLQRWGPAWHYQSNRGTLVAQNDHDTWTLLSRPLPGEGDGAADPSALLTAFAGTSFDHRVLVANRWSPRLLVSDAFRRGRVLLAGDAAHQYIPTGGYGMNTGIGDAVDLGWKLAAVLRGFGGPGLIDSYAAERRPVALRNRAASARHNDTRVAIANLYRDGLDEDSVAPHALGDAIAGIGNAENESSGIELGYWYSDSPIVIGDGGSAPSDPLRYIPTTIAGVRLPSVALEDGGSSYDLLGSWFTLLNAGPDETEAFMDAAARIGLPLTCVDPAQLEGMRTVYGTDLLLVRPDTMIAWRGALGRAGNPAAILARATGHRAS